MVTALEEAQIIKFNQQLPNRITIRLLNSEHAKGATLKEFQWWIGLNVYP